MRDALSNYHTGQTDSPRATILVVEDDRNMLDSVRSVLEIEHYDVWTAADGQSALEILAAEPVSPDLILSDIMMPRIDGIELLQQIRQDPRWDSIPFIFLTARGDRAEIQRAKRLGVDDYVIKPYDPDDLLIAIESRLQRYRSLLRRHETLQSRLRRDILTIINHEFRTPLTFVVAYADMLEQTPIEQLTDDELVSFLRGVGVGAGRLRRLIENFIVLVELETGSAQEAFEWRKRPIESLDAVLDNAVAIVQSQEDRQDDWREIRVIIEDAVPALVGDENYLTHAVVQLLDNAIKFSEPGTAVKLGLRRRGNTLHIWVQDQGRGIPQHELDRIQQSFYQVNRSLYEDQGAGAGLAIVRNITALHGGRVHISSRPGEGSTFTLMFPL